MSQKTHIIGKRQNRRSMSPRRKKTTESPSEIEYQSMLHHWLGSCVNVHTCKAGDELHQIVWPHTFRSMCTHYHTTKITYAEAIAWLYETQDFVLLQMFLQRLVELKRTTSTSTQYASALLAVGAQIQRVCFARSTARDNILHRIVEILDSGSDFVRVAGHYATVLYTPSEFLGKDIRKWAE